MNCKEFISLQAEYTDGNLDAARTAEVRAHLSECPACRRLQTEMETLVHTLHTMDDITVPETLADEVLAALQPPKKKVVQFPRFLRHWHTYSVTAACILVAVTLYTGTYDKYMMTSNEAVPHTYTAGTADTAAPVPDSAADIAPGENSKAQLPAASQSETVKRPSAATTDTAQSGQSTPPASPRADAAAPVTDNAQPLPERNITADIANTFTPETAPLQTEAMPVPAATPAQAPAAAEDVSVSEETDREAAPTEAAAASATFRRSSSTAPDESAAAAALANDTDDAVPAYDEAVPESASITAETPAARASSGGGSASAASRAVYKRENITYITASTAAEAIFERTQADGPAAVEAAFSAAGIAYSVRRETVDCTAEYNALAEEARSLSDRIADGETGLAAKLSQTESAMQTLTDTPLLSLTQD